MKGKVTIVVDDSGIHVLSELKNVSKNERMTLVHALGLTLNLEAMDYEVLAMADALGALKPSSVVDF